MADRNAWRQLLTDAASDGRAQPQRICELCVQMLDVTGGGISMVTETGNHAVVCATDDVSARIEEMQFSLGEGPCVDAVASGAPALFPDLNLSAGAALERWPAFMESTGNLDMQAIFALPLRIGAIRVGALDLYRDRPGELDPGQLAGALLAADAAAIALLHIDADVPLPLDDPTLRSAYHLRVHQATGMVQVQMGVSVDQAFVLLRARAFSAGRALTDVAADVVERRLRFSQEDG